MAHTSRSEENKQVYLIPYYIEMYNMTRLFRYNAHCGIIYFLPSDWFPVSRGHVRDAGKEVCIIKIYLDGEPF